MSQDIMLILRMTLVCNFDLENGISVGSSHSWLSSSFLRTAAVTLTLSLYLGKKKTPIPAWNRTKGFHIIWYPLHQVFAVCSSLVEFGVLLIMQHLNKMDIRSRVTCKHLQSCLIIWFPIWQFVTSQTTLILIGLLSFFNPPPKKKTWKPEKILFLFLFEERYANLTVFQRKLFKSTILGLRLANFGHFCLYWCGCLCCCWWWWWFCIGGGHCYMLAKLCRPLA